MIRVYSPLTKQYEEKSLDRISKNMYIGLLHNYMDKANSVLKKYNEVLEKTHRHLVRKKVHWVHEEFEKTPTQKLIKASSFRLNKAMKDMDTLAMEFRRDYHIDIDVHNVKETITNMIGQARLGLLYIPQLQIVTDRGVYRDKEVGYYLLRYFITVPEEKRVPSAKRRKGRNRAQELLEEMRARAAKHKRVITPPQHEEEEEYYRGKLFKVPAFLELPILINKKRLTNV